MAGSFLDASHDINQPLNQVDPGQRPQPVSGTPLFSYQPRASIAYQLRPHTGGSCRIRRLQRHHPAADCR
jgi:hypothetical protein